MSELSTFTAKTLVQKILHRNVFIEMSNLITYGGTLLNRDGNGDQKQLIVGGYTRDAISSQCRKAAIRDSISENLWYRTRLIGKYIRNEFKTMYPETSEEHLEALELVAYLYFCDKFDTDKETKKITNTKQLIGISVSEAKAFCETVANNFSEKELKKLASYGKDGKIKKDNDKLKVLSNNMVPFKIDDDTALFGRMATSDTLSTIRSAASYSFAFSTNASNNDVDYFTARDTYSDFLYGLETKGAGHLDERPVNSNCFYEYCNFNLGTYFMNKLSNFTEEELCNHELVKETLRLAVDHLIETIKRTMLVSPKAMQSQMASYPVPDCVYLTIKEGQPRSYESAFMKPIVASRDESVTDKSVKKLVEEINDETFSTGNVLHAYWISKYSEKPKNVEKVNMYDGLEALRKVLYDLLETNY